MSHMIYEQGTPRAAAAATCAYHDIEQLAVSDMHFYEPEADELSPLSDTDSITSDLYARDVRKQHHRLVLGSCAVVIGIGLILMIFIPRIPMFHLSDAAIQLDPYIVNHTVLIHNPNFYPVTLYNLRLTVTEVSVGEPTSPIAWQHREITIPRAAYKTLHVAFPAQFQRNTEHALDQCMSHGELNFVTTGTVGMGVWFRDLGNQQLGPWPYSYQCE